VILPVHKSVYPFIDNSSGIPETSGRVDFRRV
jgi:hypothetical protein